MNASRSQRDPLHRAKNHLAHGRTADARSVLKRALRRTPQDHALRLLLADTEFQREHYDHALTVYQQLQTSEAHQHKASVGVGASLTMLGRWSEALTGLVGVLQNAPDTWVAWGWMSICAGALGQPAQSQDCLRRLLAHGSPDAWWTIAEAAMTSQQFAIAVATLEQLRQADPTNHQVRTRLAVAALYQGDGIGAADILQPLVVELPEVGAIWMMLGDAHMLQGAPESALPHYQQAIVLDDNLALIHVKLGGALFRLARYEQAHTQYELAGTEPEAIAGLAAVAERRGQVSEARRLLDQLDLQTAPTTALVCLSRLNKDSEEHGATADLLWAALQENRPKTERAVLAHALGHLLDNDPDRAFALHRLGNELSHVGFDPDAHHQAVTTLITSTPRTAWEALPALPTPEGPVPIFIVGMPRSGSTLIEQVLASHPAVAAGGELEDLRCAAIQVAEQVDVPVWYLGLDQLSPSCLTQAREAYLEGLRQHQTPGTRFVTDKMPANFQHLGLVQQMLPHARVINARRSPDNTALSIFFQHFGPGLAYATSLENTGHVYREYERLMAHWRQSTDLEILDVSYEDMVSDLESTSRKILGFCGLDWHPACLDFFRLRREVSTASYDQVRRPLYNTSLDRASRYYEDLEPFRKARHSRP